MYLIYVCIYIYMYMYTYIYILVYIGAGGAGLSFPDPYPSFTCLCMSLPGFTPITISQLGFTPSQNTTVSVLFSRPHAWSMCAACFCPCVSPMKIQPTIAVMSPNIATSDFPTELPTHTSPACPACETACSAERKSLLNF